MTRMIGLPDALAAEGLQVEVVPGWRTRGSAVFNPQGAVCHWTAGGARGDRPSLDLCVRGRPDLAGPLCNVFLTRSGIAVVVAAGRANHAGRGGWGGLVGNSSVFGTEAEFHPDFNLDWTAAQKWAYPRINAAYCRLGGFGAHMVCDHYEWASPRGRKTDIRSSWPMSAMREQVRRLLAQPPSNQEDDMAWSQWVWARNDQNHDDQRPAGWLVEQGATDVIVGFNGAPDIDISGTVVAISERHDGIWVISRVGAEMHTYNLTTAT